jgi:hypothetical protein
VRIGYIIASNEVMVLGKPIRYAYREEPDNDQDSGWRVLSGEETPEYAEDANNFAQYNATTVIQHEPAFAPLLDKEFPIAFERDKDLGEFVEIDESLSDE